MDELKVVIQPLDITLTRAEFEQMCSDLLDRCRTPVEQALRDAKLAGESDW